MIRHALMGAFLVTGLASLYEGGMHGLEYGRLLTADRQAEGVIMAKRVLDAEADFGYSVAYRFRYRQATDGGPTTIFREQGVDADVYAATHVGDGVRVVYDSADPTRTSLEGAHGSLPRALFKGAVGLFFLGIGAWGLNPRRRRPFFELARLRVPAALGGQPRTQPPARP